MKYAVNYKYMTHADAEVVAKDKKEAAGKVKEVLPEAQIVSVYEVKNND